MPYAIQTVDKPGHGQMRADVRDEHIVFLKSHVDIILAGGALIDDDGTGGHGGIVILDTDDRAVAEDFAANDPFTKAGLFESVTITRWRKAFFDGAALI